MPRPRKTPSASTPNKSAARPRRQPDTLRLDLPEEREISWLWQGRIPLGKVSLLVGDPDSAKSFLALDLAARVSRGLGVPPETGLAEPARVLLLSADDDLHDTILPRLRAADADLSRITLLQNRFSPADHAAGQFLSHPDGLERLERAVHALRDCRLIIIDPLSAYLGPGVTSDHALARRVLQQLAALAHRKNAAILLISHQRKQGAPTALYRPFGSLAFATIARVVLLVANDPAVVGRRFLLPAKMTLQPDPTGRAFSVENGRLQWEPDILPLTADDFQFLVASPADVRSDPRLAAKEWLIEQLKSGRQPAETIRRRAHAEKIPWRVLVAAKADAKVRSLRDGQERRWYWKLPDRWIRDEEGDFYPTVI